MRARVAVAALVAAAHACALPPPATPPAPVGNPLVPPVVATVDASGARTIALVRRGNYLFAQAEIDGQPAGEFVIDTGAATTFVDRTVADRLRLSEVIDVPVQGLLAGASASVREVHTFTVAGVGLEGNPTVAVDLNDVSAVIGTPIAGMIGFHTFGLAPFTIDYRHATLTIHDPTRFVAPAGVQSELLRVNQVPFIEATLENGPLVWLQLDTGAMSTINLWRSFVKQYADVLRVPQKQWAVGTGIGGGTQVMVSEIHALRLFGRDYGTTPAIIQDAPENGWKHPRVAGIVGAGLLHDFRLTVDPAKRRIWAEPQTTP